MSTTYLLYLESKIKDKWKCIDGYYKHIPRGKTEAEEEFRLSCLMDNGSRSYFSETYDKMREIGYMTPFTELSAEVQEAHPGLKYCYTFFGEEKKDEIERYLTVPVSIFKSCVPKGYEYHGVYHKNAIASFENGDMEELWEDEDIDFSKMDDIQKQCYEYKEWDSPSGWYIHFKEIDKKIDFVKEQYFMENWEEDSQEMRLVVFCL